MGRTNKGIIGVVAGVALALAALAGVLLLPAADDMKVYSAGPEFSLVDQDNRPVTNKDLQGKVVLADFVFSTCTDICPLLSAKLAKVQDVLKARGWFGTKVILVSFSVDPERDTPAVLQAYGQRFGADTAGWRFITGDPDQMRTMVEKGFYLGLITTPGTGGPGRPAIEINHSDRLVLMDPKGQVRGYLSGTGLTSDAIVQEVGRLVR